MANDVGRSDNEEINVCTLGIRLGQWQLVKIVQQVRDFIGSCTYSSLATPPNSSSLQLRRQSVDRLTPPRQVLSNLSHPVIFPSNRSVSRIF